MKKVLLFAGGLVLLAVVAWGVVFYLTADMVAASDGFFAAVRKGDIAGARTFLSRDFLAATPDEELRGYLERSGLKEVAETHWGSRNIHSGGTGRLEGSVTMQSRATAPLALAFVKEDGAWKIHSLARSPAGFVVESDGQFVPSIAEAAKLAVATTVAFAKALKANDLKPFYLDTAPELQQSSTLEQFNTAFAWFLEHHIDITAAEKVAPLLTADPGVSPGGVLHVNGYFPFTNARVKFEYKYVYRFTGWKILGLHVKTLPPEDEGKKADAGDSE